MRVSGSQDALYIDELFHHMTKHHLILLTTLILAVTLLSRCQTRPPKPADPRGPLYASTPTCITCHKEIYESYAGTAHANTSSLKAPDTATNNTFHFGNNVAVKMEKEDTILYQTVYTNGRQTEKQPVDVTIGSGRKAQTYLYWKEGQYFQLPISWFVPAKSWANSPGFPADHPKFDRIIPSTCFGCHSSAVTVKDEISGVQKVEKFEKREMIAGIDCQRCHGPAAQHVKYHTEHPEVKEARYMVTIDTLSNMRQLDMCALCHSGLKPFQKSPFAFKPGDALAEYLLPTVPFPQKPSEMDVHGNQYQLLAASQCFIQSRQTMNCSSCHNPHVTERTDMQLFSQRCMSCHQPESHNFCTDKALPAKTLQQNCIDCHMPALPSSSIALLTNGQKSPTPDSIRTHLIAVYNKLP